MSKMSDVPGPIESEIIRLAEAHKRKVSVAPDSSVDDLTRSIADLSAALDGERVSLRAALEALEAMRMTNGILRRALEVAIPRLPEEYRNQARFMLTVTK